MANSKDFVLVPNRINRNFIEYLDFLGFEVPIFVTSPDELPQSTEIDLLSPWGWSPAEHKKLNPFCRFTNEIWQKHQMSKWKKSHAELLSRETTYNFITQLINSNDNSYNLLEIPSIPLKIKSLEEVKSLIDIMPPPILLKTPLSASGRGHFKIRDKNENAEQSDWIKSKLHKQKLFYAEPFLKKISDVSFHFMIEENEINYLGNTFFSTDSKGQFIGCYVRFPENPQLNKDFLVDACHQAIELLMRGLQKLEINKVYQGPLGIDAIFFEKENGKITLNPCVEVNLRHTMGLINLFLRKRIHPDNNGKWLIIEELINKNEFKLPQKSLKDGFISSGSFCLTVPYGDSGHVLRLNIS